METAHPSRRSVHDEQQLAARVSAAVSAGGSALGMPSMAATGASPFGGGATAAANGDGASQQLAPQRSVSSDVLGDIGSEALLRPGALQLVPPTPMLSQIASKARARQQHQQQQQQKQAETLPPQTAAEAAEAGAVDRGSSVPLAGPHSQQAALETAQPAPAEPARPDSDLDSMGSGAMLSPALSFGTADSLVSALSGPALTGRDDDLGCPSDPPPDWDEGQALKITPSPAVGIPEAPAEQQPADQAPQPPPPAAAEAAPADPPVAPAAPAAASSSSTNSSMELQLPAPAPANAAGAGSPTPGLSPFDVIGELGPNELFPSPHSDATDWLSSAKPRRLSYTAMSTGGSVGPVLAASAGAAPPAPLVVGPVAEQTPAPTLSVPGGAAASDGEQMTALMALRARFTRVTGTGARGRASK